MGRCRHGAEASAGSYRRRPQGHSPQYDDLMMQRSDKTVHNSGQPFNTVGNSLRRHIRETQSHAMIGIFARNGKCSTGNKGDLLPLKGGSK